MRRRGTVLALLAAALVLLALLMVFAIELSDTQAKSKHDVVTRVQQRAALAAALIDGLLQSTGQNLPQYEHTYGARTVSDATMNARRQTNAYIVLLGAGGKVLARSRGFTARARTDLPGSAALSLIRSGHLYALGDLLPYGRTGVINFAIAFPTRFGKRTLLTGFRPSVLNAFLGSDLREIPRVRGAQNYVVDANDHVLASTSRALGAGDLLRSPRSARALPHRSGSLDGQYFEQIPLRNTTWRIVLAAPDGPLFASVSGLRKWIPWLIFAAFALVALVALAMGARALQASVQLRVANGRLSLLNGELGAANQALRHRARELARSNADLEQFASIASHDLQEPLRKVRTFTGQVAETEAERLSDTGRDRLARANASAERMQRLIEDLLRFARVATHGRPFEAVDLGQLAGELLDDLHTEEAVIRVGELPTINADPLQIRQLLQNLISNALKFHREGIVPEVTIEARRDGAEIELAISDNGIGFDPRYSQRIFRVFERLHGRHEYPGTGIGLALCRKIAERHGGEVFAQSTPGQGSTFTVRLPVQPPHDVPAAPPAPGEELAHAGL
jgi:signal transduction histidine kinase